MFLGLLWFCVMLHSAWPNECPGGDQRPSQPLPPPRKRSSDPKPFPGLTRTPPQGFLIKKSCEISFLCCPSSPLSRELGGAQGSESMQVDPRGRVWYSHLPWHITDSGSTKTPSSRSSAITGGPSSSAIRATRIATCRP